MTAPTELEVARDIVEANIASGDVDDDIAVVIVAGLIADIAEILPASEAGWRDMDSAPKDGTRILVIGHRGDQSDIAQWGKGRYLGKVKGYAQGWATHPGYLANPTHWMPLPSAPDRRPA